MASAASWHSSSFPEFYIYTMTKGFRLGAAVGLGKLSAIPTLRTPANHTTAASAYAQTAKYCPSEASGVCYSVNVPSGSSGDLYFQIQGPSTEQWIGLGQGNQMAGANIFMVYADADGKNVTVSPRKGVGNVKPQYPSGTQITLLAGSGIANGTMTANVRCKFSVSIPE